jgi:hypothetical protein
MNNHSPDPSPERQPRRNACDATRTTISGRVFVCCLREHSNDPSAHYFRDQVATVRPLRHKQHLTLLAGGLS